MEPRRVILIHLRDTNCESANVNMYYVYMVQKIGKIQKDKERAGDVSQWMTEIPGQTGGPEFKSLATVNP